MLFAKNTRVYLASRSPRRRELLRQIGVAPVRHSRGPKEHDPGPKEFMYAGVWAFNEDAFVKQRHRLQVHSMPDIRHALNTHEI